MDSSERAPVRVSLLAVPESTPATLYGLYEVFSAAGITWSQLTGERQDCRRMDTRIVAAGGEAFRCAVGAPIAPHASIEQTPQSDLIVVGDLSLQADQDPGSRWARERAWIVRQFAQGAVVCSVCTGSVLLAAAGLLDGVEATTHWSAARLFSTHFPSVRLRPERILVPAGPEHRIVTSGGSASWEDLALYLVARFCGEAEAVRIAKIFVFGDRSEGQAPYAAMAVPRRHDDRLIAECQAWLAEHYAARNPVALMVERSGLSERTFNRRFKTATGYSCVEYVQALRIEEAKQLLEATDDATDAIARAVGYEDPAFFRRLFKRRTGTTPARY